MMPSMPDHVPWTRSIIVAAAIVVAALIPVVADGDDRKSIPKRVSAQRPASNPSPELTGNRRVCQALDGLPVSVLEKRYKAIYDDTNGSGDSAVPMLGGICWIKWSYTDSKTARDYYALRVRFYDDAG